jgi:hypothetical protein
LMTDRTRKLWNFLFRNRDDFECIATQPLLTDDDDDNDALRLLNLRFCRIQDSITISNAFTNTGFKRTIATHQYYSTPTHF